MRIEKAVIWFLGVLFFASGQVQAVQKHRISSATGAETWEVDAHGVRVSLTQILPEQLRAFYLNRGFTQPQIAAYERSCVYMTVLKNKTAPAAIHFHLSTWQVISETRQSPIKLTETWLDELGKGGVSRPALIAFQWAQFPTEQTYESGGDWNQGMLSVGLPAGALFDITARWQVGERTREAVLKGVRCAG